MELGGGRGVERKLGEIGNGGSGKTTRFFFFNSNFRRPPWPPQKNLSEFRQVRMLSEYFFYFIFTHSCFATAPLRRYFFFVTDIRPSERFTFFFATAESRRKSIFFFWEKGFRQNNCRRKKFKQLRRRVAVGNISVFYVNFSDGLGPAETY